jgi:hypothetical protein
MHCVEEYGDNRLRQRREGKSLAVFRSWALFYDILTVVRFLQLLFCWRYRSFVPILGCGRPAPTYASIRQAAFILFSIHPQWLVVAAFVSLALETPTLQAQQVTPTPPTTGQGPTFTVTGTVIAEATRQPLPYSTVVFDPLGGERFTDQGGSFTYFAVPAGKYKVKIRQLGYTPMDTTIVVAAGTTNPVFLLNRVPSTLEDVQVIAPVRR